MSVKKISAAANVERGASAGSWYGYRFQPLQSDTEVERVAYSDDLLVTMPLHQQIRHACVNDDRTVNYWLDSSVLSKKADGTAADLSGTDGQVMGLLPAHYKKCWLADGYEYRVMSEKFFVGSTYVPAMWMGTFPATKDASDKLESVSGKSALTSVTAANFLVYARNRGSKWSSLAYQAIEVLYEFFVTETGDRDFQSAVSDGLTDVVSGDWNAYNAYAPLWENGASAGDSVVNGEVAVSIENFVGGTGTLDTQVAVYRQFRLLTGIYEWVSNLAINNDGTSSKAYMTEDWDDFAYDTTTNADFAGNLAEVDGYIKEMLQGTILPKNTSLGGDSSTYYADYYYSRYDNDPIFGWVVVRFFGTASDIIKAGYVASYFGFASSYSSAVSGSRLCAIANLD